MWRQRVVRYWGAAGTLLLLWWPGELDVAAFVGVILSPAIVFVLLSAIFDPRSDSVDEDREVSLDTFTVNDDAIAKTDLSKAGFATLASSYGYIVFTFSVSMLTERPERASIWMFVLGSALVPAWFDMVAHHLGVMNLTARGRAKVLVQKYAILCLLASLFAIYGLSPEWGAVLGSLVFIVSLRAPFVALIRGNPRRD